VIYVIGDCFVDRYWIGVSERLSPEAPIPVVRVEKCVTKDGGAGNVWRNIQALGKDGDKATKLLSSSAEVTWPIKNRLMVGDYQLARWDENDRCEEYNEFDELEDVEALVIADYGKGSITPKVIEKLAHKISRCTVYVDTKDSPLKFEPLAGARDVTIFPNTNEYKQWHFQYMDFSEWGTVVVKLGAEGMMKLVCGRVVEKVEAENKKPLCVIGAGDTAMAAYAVAETEQREDVLVWANHAAGMAVGMKYTGIVSREEWLHG
jgi:D-beta-D-heptose 7-phosphate kinase/D-beta-D-heptose 1-phosphate adenosyltransferase